MSPLPKIEARVRLHNDTSGRETRLLAFAELLIGEAFVIRGIRILEKHDGKHGVVDEPFVTFPAERGKSSERWYDIAHPSTSEARKAAVTAILDAYQAAAGARR